MRPFRAGIGATLAAACIGAAPAAPRTLATDAHLSTFAFCPDGHTVIGREGTGGWLIDWPSGNARRAEEPAGMAPPCAAMSLGYSPDGKWWATGSEGSSSVLVRDASGKEVRQLQAHIGSVYRVVFSPDGRYLASGGADNDVHIWDARNWAMVKTIDSMTYTPFALAWAPDSSVLYVGGSSRNVMAWSAATWSLLRSSTPQRFAIGDIAVSPDGRTVAAAGWDPDASGRPAAVLVLDAATLAERLAIATPGPAEPVAFSPDGKAIVGLVRGQAGLTVWPME